MPLITVSKCINCQIAHEWFFTGATLKELRLIKALTGMSANEFARAGDEGDPDALAALLAILHKRIGINIPFEDVDLDFETFDMKATDEEKADIEKLEQEMKRAADEAQAPKV